MPTTQIPFPVNETLTGVVVAFKNDNLVADRVLPEMTVLSKKYNYIEYPKGMLFTIPETRVGRKSMPNQPDFEGEEKTDTVDDRGLMDFIPQDDIDEALETVDPRSLVAEWLTNLIDLDREVKAANVVFAPGTYLAGQQEELTGTDRFDDPANSKPIEVISDALEVPLIRPNRIVFGSKVWTNFRRHPKIVEAIVATGAKEGMVSRQAVAELFEVDEVIVGQSRLNVAKKGQDVNLQRVWGNHISLVHIDPTASTQRGITFGGTPRFKQRFAGNWQDMKPGTEGGEWVKVADHFHEKIFAPDLGYFIQNAVS